MIQLDYRDARPIYEQVRDSLRQLILSGAIRTGEQLPSVRSLAATLAINPNTIKRAYDELEREGYLSTVPGKGCFAAPVTGAGEQRREELLDSLDKICTELKLMGVTEQELCDRIRGTGGNRT